MARRTLSNRGKPGDDMPPMASVLQTDLSTLDSSDREYVHNLALAVMGKFQPTLPDLEMETAAPKCPACDYGYVRIAPRANPGDPQFGRFRPCPVCRDPGIEQRAIAKALRNASIPVPFIASTFDSYRAIPEADKEAADWVEEWTEKTIANPEVAGSIALVGEIGTGKTGCGAAAFRRLIHGTFRIAIFANTVEMFTELGQAIAIGKRGGEPSTSEAEILYRISEAELLMLDDIGAERWTDYREEKLYQILGYRHSRKLCTIITSNKTLDELKTQLGPRTHSRLIEMCAGNIIEFECEDLRLAIAERRG